MVKSLKSIIKFLLIKISRIIYWITPVEFKEKPRHDYLTNRLTQNLIEETLEHFKDKFQKSILFRNDSWKIREYAIKASIENDKNKDFFYLEFGVYKGGTANFTSKFVKKLYAFDSFEGLKEDWAGKALTKNHFTLNKQIPTLNSNIEPVVGWVEDTVEDFLKKHNPKINYVHLDMDTYSPTKFVLERIKPYLVKDAIIIFDEYFEYFGWAEGEYKALNEVFQEDEFTYKAFNIGGQQCVIQIK